jgi:alanyl-tRNA synthetase
MAIMTVENVRNSFLEFFQQHEHHLVSSAPLVPAEDQTLLFINAGMNQFKEVIL